MLTTSEHAEQSAVIEWKFLHINICPELALLHSIPNGARLPFIGKGKARFSKQAVILKEEGLLPGVPDLFLPCPRKGFCGIYIEMKVKPNKPSPEQLTFLQMVLDQGYKAEICWSATEAIKLLCWYLDCPYDGF